MSLDEIRERYQMDNPDYGPDVVRSAEWKEGYDAAVRRYGDDLNRITAAIEAAWIDGKIALTAAELKDLLSMTEKPLDKIEASITHGQRAP